MNFLSNDDFENWGEMYCKKIRKSYNMHMTQMLGIWDEPY